MTVHRTSPLIIGLVAAATALSACTTMTPYQEARPGQQVAGGYSEVARGEGRYQVSFSGNSLTARDRVEGYLLFRAAELTIRDGYDWFLIIDRFTEHDTETYVRPDPFYRPYYGGAYGFWRPHWRYSQRGRWGLWHPESGGPFLGGAPELQTIERFEAHAEIVLRRGPIPAGEERAFDARRVIADLGPTIERPGERR